MTVLGQAFIEVRGDVAPFVDGLERQVRRAAERIEQDLRNAIDAGLGGSGLGGERSGEELGESLGRGMRRRLGDRNRSPWTNIAAALGSALDDGLSALPAEVKAALVAGMIAALPLIAGALAGAVSAAIGVGLAGVGTLLAFQFQDVEDVGSRLADRLQVLFVGAASSFAPAVIQAMNQIAAKFQQLAPVLNRIFAKSADFVQPLTAGLLNFIDRVLKGIDASMGDIEGFVKDLGGALRTVGILVSEVIQRLAGTGEAGRAAFRDFVYTVSVLILNMTDLIVILTEVYYFFRQIAEALAFIQPLIGLFIQQSDAASQSSGQLATSNLLVADSMATAAQRTAEQEKELRELDRALEGAKNATYGIIEAQIDFERSIDDITDALKENGATFNLTNEQGRQNVEEFMKGLQAAEQEALNFTATGKMSAAEAAVYYDQQIAKLRQLATTAGIAGSEFDTLFGQIISVANLKLDANAMGITATERELQQAVGEATKLYQQLQNIRNFRLPTQGTRRFSEYAEGGIIAHPTMALMGEAGPEVVIPLTKPARAAELMQQTGLAGMLTAQATVVNVYVGNEQLDARTYRIVEENNSTMSNSLAFGARGL